MMAVDVILLVSILVLMWAWDRQDAKLREEIRRLVAENDRLKASLTQITMGSK
jgi:hypothetical protein